MSYLDDMAALLGSAAFEGTVPWMYQDTLGNVTVGMGLLLPTADRACQLPFHAASDPQPAGEEEVRADFARVAAMAKGMAAARYQTLTSLVLPPTEIQQLCVSHLRQDEAGLRGMFPEYDGFPVAAKMALLDMAYNMGIEDLVAKWPREDGFVVREDWVACAGNCHRIGISQGRNDWTRQQFEAAAGTAQEAA